jgi:hypothetical protein
MDVLILEDIVITKDAALARPVKRFANTPSAVPA